MMKRSEVKKKKLTTSKSRGQAVAPKLGGQKKKSGGILGAQTQHSLPLKGNEFSALLSRERRKRGSETKHGVRLTDSIPQSVMDADALESMSEGVSAWTTYNVTLKGFSTLGTTIGGVANFAIPVDPSSTGYNFAEYTNLAALFGEVRVLRFEIQLVTFYYPSTSTAVTPIIVGFNPTLSTAPGSEGVVATLIDSEYWAANGDRSARGAKFSVKFDPRLGFSLTSSVTVTPYAGCPGGFQLYGSGFNVSSNVAKVLVCGLYQFRSRQ